MRQTLFVVALLVGCRHATVPVAAVPLPADGLIEHVVKPEQADPAASKWLEPQHAAVNRAAPRPGRLVVYLVGANSKPSGSRTMYAELASMGFHVIAPMYANDYGIAGVCQPGKDPDDDCHGKARLEAFEGKDHSAHLDVSRANSAEERVVKMLAHLERAFPGEGWGAFLDGDKPRWEQIVIAGHSHGASSTGLISKVRRVHRAVMLSGPFDNRGGTPAAWTRQPSVTPVDRVYGFSHKLEDQYAGHLADWEAMGIPGAPTLVDDSAPPYGGSHRLVTTLPAVAGKNPHGVTAAGGASPKVSAGGYQLSGTWRHLFAP